MPNNKYVLITPAKNEEANIEWTMRSVIAQTLRPEKWVIVDDGSTDRTSQMVAGYAERYSFISLLRLENSETRNFAKKAFAFNAGLQFLNELDYSYIGNLDADISFGPDYYSNVIAELQRHPELGISGGIVYTTVGRRFTTNDQTVDSVGGAVQLFRRECFEQIGGYVALERGGMDAAAEIMARMHGWKVRKLLTNLVYESRRTGSAQASPLAACYKEGLHFHSLGYSLAFYVGRCLNRLNESPIILGSLASLLGFAIGRIWGVPICLPEEVVEYLKAEQMNKLKNELLTKLQAVRSVF